jgi:hypothetical protein
MLSDELRVTSYVLSGKYNESGAVLRCCCSKLTNSAERQAEIFLFIFIWLQDLINTTILIIFEVLVAKRKH